ncbi:hypothetical protein D3C78_1242680 [compost metagenome]
MFMSTGLTPKAAAICGMAVTITVASRFSIKKAPATSSGSALAREKKLMAECAGRSKNSMQA